MADTWLLAAMVGRLTPNKERTLFPDNFLSVYNSPICKIADYGL